MKLKWTDAQRKAFWAKMAQRYKKLRMTKSLKKSRVDMTLKVSKQKPKRLKRPRYKHPRGAPRPK